MNKKITIKQSENFNKQVSEMIKFNLPNAVCLESDKEDSRYKVQTNLGILNIHIPSNSGFTVYTVYCRFEDPTIAKGITGCRHNGKHNFHEFNPEALKIEFARFIGTVKRYSTAPIEAN